MKVEQSETKWLVFSELDEDKGDVGRVTDFCVQHGYTVAEKFGAEIGGLHIVAQKDGKPIPINPKRFATHVYAGAEWLKRQRIPVKGGYKAIELSPFGERVADLLGYVFRGLYHIDNPETRSKDWSNNYHIEFRLPRSLSTYDDSQLTELVLLAHRMAIRVDIHPLSHWSLRLIFHNRVRDGEWHNSHPSIEEALAYFDVMCGVAAAEK